MRERFTVRSGAEALRGSRRRVAWIALALLQTAALPGTIACGPRDEPQTAFAESARTAGRPQAARPEVPRVVCLGDSLTAGLGLSPREAYPALLQDRIQRAGYPHEVVNAGVSGDTSAGGLRRLDWSIDESTRVLIVALGANDGLRGLPVAALRRNLSDIVQRAESRGIAVVLAGMEAPPNFGPAYVREFRAVYADVARDAEVPFVPFLLDGVAGIGRLNQTDGIHPTAEGQRLMADLVWRELEPVLRTSPPR
jgi:acyl-CoA thioesterase-1